MSSQLKTIILKRGKEESLLRFHPWVFSGAIAHLPEGLEEGETVRVEASGRPSPRSRSLRNRFNSRPYARFIRAHD